MKKKKLKKKILSLFFAFSLLAGFALIFTSKTNSEVQDSIDLGTISSTGYFSSASGAGDGKYRSIMVSLTNAISSTDKITLPSVTGYTVQSVSTDYTKIIKIDDSTGKTSGEIIKNYVSKIKFALNSSQSVRVELFEEVLDKSTFYYSINGHYYQYVSQYGLSWGTAYDNAKGMTLRGRKGYLATITTLEEDLFISKVSQAVGWLGGTRLGFTSGTIESNAESLKGTGTSSLFNTSSGGSSWYWACGPEAGTVFYGQPVRWSAEDSKYADGSYYSNWATKDSSSVYGPSNKTSGK